MQLTFVLAKAQPGLSSFTLAQRIRQHTELRARSSEQLKQDTIGWYLVNSEYVGDMATMLTLAMTVGFGVTQAGICALIGTGLGLGACSFVGEIVAKAGYPFRMMWFTPVIGIVGVPVVSIMAAAISARPVLKLQPAVVFAGR